jgi:hypothetical protein
MRVDRGYGTLPFFVRSLHAAAFVDAGQAWTGRVRWQDARVSAGVEVSADTVLGFALPVTLTGGAAWRRDPQGGGDGPVVFARIGRAF